jgi:hypothetical protein
MDGSHGKSPKGQGGGPLVGDKPMTGACAATASARPSLANSRRLSGSAQRGDGLYFF